MSKFQDDKFEKSCKHTFVSSIALMNTFIHQKQQTIRAGKTDIYKERRTQLPVILG